MLMPYKRYFDFSGRSRRKEFWMWVLFYVIVAVVCNLLDSALGLGGTTTSYSDVTDSGVSMGYSSRGGILAMIWGLVNLIPAIAVSVRRVHDHDKSGWFILIPIYNLILYCMEGTRGPNRFGPDPKASDTDAQTFS
jgi:uncharacterized membrane protein YhaH (DUF805 family)